MHWRIPRITLSPELDGREGVPSAVCRGVHLSLRGSRGWRTSEVPSQCLSLPSFPGWHRTQSGRAPWQVLWRRVKPWVMPAHHHQRNWSWHRTQPQEADAHLGRRLGRGHTGDRGSREPRTFTGLCWERSPMTWTLSRLQSRNPKSSSGYKNHMVSLTKVTHL